MSHGVLSLLQHRLDAEVARRVTDDAHAFTSRNLKEPVVGFARKVAVNLDEVVTGALLLDEVALHFVWRGSMNGRVRDERPARIKLGAEQFAASDFRAQIQVMWRPGQAENGGHAV